MDAKLELTRNCLIFGASLLAMITFDFLSGATLWSTPLLSLSLLMIFVPMRRSSTKADYWKTTRVILRACGETKHLTRGVRFKDYVLFDRYELIINWKLMMIFARHPRVNLLPNYQCSSHPLHNTSMKIRMSRGGGSWYPPVPTLLPVISRSRGCNRQDGAERSIRLVEGEGDRETQALKKERERKRADACGRDRRRRVGGTAAAAAARADSPAPRDFWVSNCASRSLGSSVTTRSASRMVKLSLLSYFILSIIIPVLRLVVLFSISDF